MRLGLWSLAAVVAVAVAVWVGRTDTGFKRLTQALASVQEAPAQDVPAHPNPVGREPLREIAPARETLQLSAEMQRLADSLNEINIDRNRLLERLEAIERHLNDLTGSVARNIYTMPQLAGVAPLTSGTTAGTTMGTTTAALAAPVTAAEPGNSGKQTQFTPSPAEASPPVTTSPPTTAVPHESTPAEPVTAAKIEFGIDLGGAQTIEGLRTLWLTTKSRHGALLDGMRPLITVREKGRSAGVELRLVAGPIPNAAQAARLCATITAAGAVCQPSVFDGQRLALR